MGKQITVLAIDLKGIGTWRQWAHKPHTSSNSFIWMENGENPAVLKLAES